MSATRFIDATAEAVRATPVPAAMMPWTRGPARAAMIARRDAAEIAPVAPARRILRADALPERVEVPFRSIRVPAPATPPAPEAPAR